MCRTYNFGDIGSSSGQYFRLFLKPIKLNEGGGCGPCCCWDAISWPLSGCIAAACDRTQPVAIATDMQAEGASIPEMQSASVGCIAHPLHIPPPAIHMPLPPRAAACRPTEDVRWDKMDMSYLQRDNYARMFAAELAGATPLESVGALGIAQCCLLLPAAACCHLYVQVAGCCAGCSDIKRACEGYGSKLLQANFSCVPFYWPTHADEVPKVAPGRDYVLRYTSQQHYEKITGRLRMLREWRVSMQGSMGGSRSAAAPKELYAENAWPM